MEATTLKDKIHRLIDNSSEDVLQSVFQLLEEPEYTNEFKNFLNEEMADYHQSKSTISQKEMNEIIDNAMKK
jgi:predicted house-cleaning noncanonical NTP pyrophosphatase (MazG superfamily)